MNPMIRMMMATLLALLLPWLAGCESRAGDDTSARLAALEQQVAALDARADAAEAARPAVIARAPAAAAASARGATRAAAELSPVNPCADLGTLTGRPTTGDPIADATFALVSCTGYLYKLFDDGEQATLLELPPNAVFYATADCTGPAYVARGYGTGLTPAAFRQGAVGILGGAAMALPANAEAVPGLVAESFLFRGAGAGASIECQPRAGQPISFEAVELQPNDPAVTGVESAPLLSPVTVGT